MALQRDLTLELALGLRELTRTSVLRGLLHALRQRLRAAYATLRPPHILDLGLRTACAKLTRPLRRRNAAYAQLTHGLRHLAHTMCFKCVGFFYEILSEFCLRK